MTHERNVVPRDRDVTASLFFPHTTQGGLLLTKLFGGPSLTCFGYWVYCTHLSRQLLSSKNSSSQTAEDEIEQFLKRNNGWHEVADLANATGYSKSHVRTTAKQMASTHSSMERRKNPRKRVIGYVIKGDLVVPGGDRSVLLSIIKTHATSVPSNLGSKTVKQLQRYIRSNIATDSVPLDSKLEFRWT